jgi:hypothetical protein
MLVHSVGAAMLAFKLALVFRCQRSARRCSKKERANPVVFAQAEANQPSK